MPKEIVVASCSQVTDPLAAETSILLMQVYRRPTVYLRLRGLAGPNDVLQILTDGPGWLVIAKTFGVVFGSALLAEAGKDSWRWLKEFFSSVKEENTSPAWTDEQLIQLSSVVRKAMIDNTVTFGININTYRNIGVIIDDADPINLVKIATSLGLHVERLMELIAIETQNRPFRVHLDERLKVEPDGSLTATLSYTDPATGYERISVNSLDDPTLALKRIVGD